MDVEEPGSGIVTTSPGTVTQQVKHFNTFFKKNPGKFPSKHPSEVTLSSLKPAAAQADKSEKPETEVSLEGNLSSEVADTKGAIYLSLPVENINSLDTLPQDKMPIGVVPTAVSSTYTPSQKPEPPETTGHSIPSHTPTDEPQSAGQASGPEAAEHSSNLVALAVKFFSTPDTSSPSAPSRSLSEEAQSLAAENGVEEQTTSLNQGVQAGQKVTGGNVGQPSKTIAKSPGTPSPTQARSSSPKVSGGRRNANKPNYTVPEPFSLATDRRAALSSRIPDLPSTPSTKPKAGVVRASFSSPQVPPKPAPKPTTSPEPFKLESVRRHEEAQERIKAEIRAREKEEEERRNFKAQPFIGQHAPSPPVKSFPPTQGAVFTFACDERAEKRKEFVKRVEAKESQKIQEKQSILETTRAELEEQIKEYRKNLIFKAVPMPRFYNRVKQQQRSDGTSPGAKSMSRRRSLGGPTEASSPGTPSPDTPPSAVRPPARRKSAGDAESLLQTPKGKDSRAKGTGPTWSAKRPMGAKGGKGTASESASPDGAAAKAVGAKAAQTGGSPAKRAGGKGAGKGPGANGTTPAAEAAASANEGAASGAVKTPGGEPEAALESTGAAVEGAAK